MNCSRVYRFILVIGILILSSCRFSSTLTNPQPTVNSKASLKKPYLILISLDGFRWDYVEKYAPTNIRNFIKNGVKAESLIPSFPSKTFPNHYTIATGMYPDKHGIIGNSFYSHKKNVTYKIRNPKMVTDGTFYGGSPIWVQADKQKMVSASYFYVGSEADIQGRKPTYYHKYNGSVKNDTRVSQALDWLAMPEKERPHMITLYFSDMDSVGHGFGTDNDDKLSKTLFKLDKTLGNLFKGVKETGLPVNIIIVSDHGMTTVPTANFISVDAIKNNNLYSLINNGAMVNIHPKKDVSIDSIIQFLKTKQDNFKVYKTENTPGFEYKPKNKDWGAIQVIPDFGYYFMARAAIASKKKMSNTSFGMHGYHPKYKDMHGVFYANGPAFKKNHRVSSFKNIHVYPLMCEILGLKIPNDIDGELNQIKDVLVID